MTEAFPTFSQTVNCRLAGRFDGDASPIIGASFSIEVMCRMTHADSTWLADARETLNTALSNSEHLFTGLYLPREDPTLFLLANRTLHGGQAAIVVREALVAAFESYGYFDSKDITPSPLDGNSGIIVLNEQKLTLSSVVDFIGNAIIASINEMNNSLGDERERVELLEVRIHEASGLAELGVTPYAPPESTA